MALLHAVEDKSSQEDRSAEGRHLSEPEKAYPTDGFVIVTKFGSHVLRCFASSLSNVIRQVDR